MSKRSQRAAQSRQPEHDDAALIMCDGRLTILDVDEDALRWLGAGLSREEAVGRGLADLVPDRERCDRYRRVLETGQRSVVEEEVAQPGGHKAVLVTRAFRAGDRLVIVVSDVTARRQAEARLRASESKHRLAVEGASDLVWISDVHLNTAYVSPSVETVLGFAADGPMAHDLAGQMTPESLDRLDAAIESYLAEDGGRGADPRRTFRVELERCRRDGSTLWMEDHISCLRDARGKVVGFHGVARDIGRQRESQAAQAAIEATYRKLFDQAVNGMAVLEASTGRVVLGNNTLAEMFGFGSAADMAGVDALGYVMPQEREWVGQRMALLIADPEKCQMVTIRVKTRDGREMTVSGSGAALEHNGRPAILISIMDTTAASEAERRLQESEEKHRQLIVKTNDIIWTAGLDLALTYVSPSVERALGFTPEEHLRRSLEEQLTPGSLAAARRALAEHLELEETGQADPGRMLRIDLEYYCKDGSTVWMEQQISALRDGDGTLTGIHGVARDISRQKEAQAALEASEAKYRNLFDHSLQGIEVLDPDTGRVVLANRSMARMFGFPSPESVVGVNPLEYVMPDDREWVEHDLGQVMVDPSWDKVDTVKMRTADGGIKWVSALATPVDYEGGQAMLVSVVDMTRAREAEIRLLESEARNRVVVENTNEAIAVLQDGLIKFGNRRLAIVLGCSAQEYRGRPFMEDFVHPDDRKMMSEYAARRRSGAQAPTTYEFRFLNKAGEVGWAEANVSLVDWEGRGATLISMNVITERKGMAVQILKAHAELEARVEQRTVELREANRLLIDEIRQRQRAQKKLQESESEYRELVENASSIIMEVDTRGRVTFFNRFAEEFYGFKEAEVLGRPVVGTIAPPVDSAGKDMKAEIRSMVKRPEDHFVVENEGMRRNGERVWISWTNKGLYDAEGRLRNVLCIGMDRTEQRRVADMLAEQLKEKAAGDERQRLARDLHDAVTQTLFSASLIAEVLPRLWRKDRGEAERRLEELRRLTRGALAEMRMLLLELRPGALGEVGLVELLRQQVEALTAQTKIRLDLRLGGKCDVPAEVQVALFRVAQEALNNVVRHSGATEAGVRLTCRPGAVNLLISDNGSGFDSGAVAPKSLGLRIMRERVEAVGASLKIAGRPGGGTTVRAAWSEDGGRRARGPGKSGAGSGG